ncbi:MAG TPA: glycosyltransferase family 39 protein [Burkholderiales bacterium]|nr:glycosyltransferase family 39 protein [Burkholderiales bacterium]
MLAAAALILAFKLGLSAVLPLTGDEAYFLYWGIYPDFGYYDHPPMIGWLLYLVHRISNAPWLLRLPVTLLSFALAAGVYFVLRGADEIKAALAALAFMLLPVNVWAVLITTDTPLIFFSFASVLAYWQGLVRRAPAWHALAGAFLGLAFLSKYFAVLLGLAYVAYTVSSPRGKRDWRALSLVVLCSLPFAAINLWWNYEHCWANLMFNAYNRNEGAGWSWKTPFLYAVSVLYLLSPVALWQLAKDRRAALAALADPATRFFAFMFAFPFGFFAVLSLVKQIGLHWMLGFVPFFFVLAGWILSREQLRRSVVYLGAFSALHVAAIAVAAALPLETWKNARVYDGIVYHVRINDVLRELEPYEGQFALAADGYSPAVTASYYSGKYFFVFGRGSSYARQDDILTDFRPLDGKDILILRKDPPEDPEYRPYFRSVEYKEFTLSGATFHLVLGRGFDFPAYREVALKAVRDRLYAIPRYLPQGRCYFCERYFDAPTCPVRK